MKDIRLAKYDAKVSRLEAFLKKHGIDQLCHRNIQHAVADLEGFRTWQELRAVTLRNHPNEVASQTKSEDVSVSQIGAPDTVHTLVSMHFLPPSAVDRSLHEQHLDFGHLFILGASGVGKSFTISKFLKRDTQHHRGFVITLGGVDGHAYQKVKLHHLPQIPNPLRFSPTEALSDYNLAMLRGFILTLLDEIEWERNMSQEVLELLDRTIRKLSLRHRNEGEFSISDLRDALMYNDGANHELGHALANDLRPWCPGGSRGDVFTSKADVDFSASTILDVSSCRQQPEMPTLIAGIICAAMHAPADRPLRELIIDLPAYDELLPTFENIMEVISAAGKILRTRQGRLVLTGERIDEWSHKQWLTGENSIKNFLIFRHNTVTSSRKYFQFPKNVSGLLTSMKSWREGSADLLMIEDTPQGYGVCIGRVPDTIPQ